MVTFYFNLGTCKCPKYLFTQWYERPPFVKLANDTLTGLFPDLIRELVIAACGKCKDYPESILNYNSTRSGGHPNRKTERSLKESISNDVDVSFPYFGRTDFIEVVPNSSFVSIIPSPGGAFIIRDERNVRETVMKIVLSILKVWPFLLISYSIATIFGFLIWYIVSV